MNQLEKFNSFGCKILGRKNREKFQEFWVEGEVEGKKIWVGVRFQTGGK